MVQQVSRWACPRQGAVVDEEASAKEEDKLDQEKIVWIFILRITMYDLADKDLPLDYNKR